MSQTHPKSEIKCRKTSRFKVKNSIDFAGKTASIAQAVM